MAGACSCVPTLPECRDRRVIQANHSHDGKQDIAQRVAAKVRSIDEEVLDPDHPYNGTALQNYTTLLREMRREREAVRREARASAIRIRFSAIGGGVST